MDIDDEFFVDEAEYEEEEGQLQLEAPKTGMYFCDGCFNLLFPRINHEMKVLEYYCTCGKSQRMEFIAPVYHNDISGSSSSEIKVKNVKMIQDPTLPRDKLDRNRCPVCDGLESVTYQPTLESMELMYVCTDPQCNHMWELTKGDKREEDKKVSNEEQ